MTLFIGVHRTQRRDLGATHRLGRAIYRRLGSVLAAALASTLFAAVVAGQPAELLNSERIERVFGSYRIAVLESGAEVRVSNLYSVEGAREICRTFAVVRYPAAVAPAFATEHAAIVAGGSIGAVFAAAGWRVEKTHLHYGTVRAQGHAAALMSLAPGVELAAHVYELTVVKNDARHRYATIVEIHHPDYLQLEDLPEIYGPLAEPPTAEVNELLATAIQKMR